MVQSKSEQYICLLQTFPPRPIKSEEDFFAVQSVIDDLIDSPEMTQEQQDYLNILGMLVHEYEEQNINIPDISGVYLLTELIKEFGFKQKDLVPVFKTESIVSAVLNGQRKLTLEHVEKLAIFFNVSPAAFFPPSS